VAEDRLGLPLQAFIKAYTFAMCAAVKNDIWKRLLSTRGKDPGLTSMVEPHISGQGKKQLVLTIKIHCIEHTVWTSNEMDLLVVA
jgi:hypothetical protein